MLPSPAASSRGFPPTEACARFSASQSHSLFPPRSAPQAQACRFASPCGQSGVHAHTHSRTDAREPGQCTEYSQSRMSINKHWSWSPLPCTLVRPDVPIASGSPTTACGSHGSDAVSEARAFRCDWDWLAPSHGSIRSAGAELLNYSTFTASAYSGTHARGRGRGSALT